MIFGHIQECVVLLELHNHPDKQGIGVNQRDCFHHPDHGNGGPKQVILSHTIIRKVEYVNLEPLQPSPDLMNDLVQLLVQNLQKTTGAGYNKAASPFPFLFFVNLRL